MTPQRVPGLHLGEGSSRPGAPCAPAVAMRHIRILGAVVLGAAMLFYAAAWVFYTQQTLVIWSLLMLPLFVTLETALVAQWEHHSQQWKHLFALPVSRGALYAAKYLCSVAFIGLSCTLMIALIIMMPLLCIYADLMGILGGMIVGVGMLEINPTEYVNRTQAALSLSTFWIGLFHSAVFGVLVALAGCLRGMQCGRSASDVGYAATSAVVSGIISIILATALITFMCQVLGL